VEFGIFVSKYDLKHHIISPSTAICFKMFIGKFGEGIPYPIKNQVIDKLMYHTTNISKGCISLKGNFAKKNYIFFLMYKYGCLYVY
jgi:hypothetical protein